MGDDRDVTAFSARAAGYDGGWLGHFHHQVAGRVLAVLDAADLRPRRVLDVGCGTGHLLRLLAEHYPTAEALVGVDSAAGMVEVARATKSDERIEVQQGSAERLPFAAFEFDLVVSTTSFDHWHDQPSGLRECARVLDPNGMVVIADLFSPLLVPTLVGSRRHKARTRRRAERLLSDSGLRLHEWHKIQTLLQAFVAHPESPG